MSVVIPFPCRTYLRLDSGIVRDAADPRRVTVVFWLEFVEPDGGRANIWDGESYAEALGAAKYALEPGMRFEDAYAGGG